MPETTVLIAIDRVRWRWRVRAILLAAAGAGAAFAAALVVSSITVAIGAAVIAIAVMIVRSPALSSLEAARLIERTAGSLDNLVVTAVELEARPRPVRAEIALEIARMAADRIQAVQPYRIVPLAQPAAVAAVVLIGCALLTSLRSSPVDDRIAVPQQAAERIDLAALTVTVMPPQYTRRKVDVVANPVQVEVIAGSRVRIEAAGAVLRDLVAAESAALELRTGGVTRFLSILVVPDAAPALRIVTPGKDTALAEPKGQVPIAIESRDDIGLSSLTLQFTKASGGGENVSFTEGEIPLRINRSSDRQWRAQAALALESLSLEEGDIVVYRATARDTNPAGAPVQSEQYVIEIGKNAAIVDAGFSLPSEEKKYAISQQMVIYHTEQLLQRGAGGGAAVLDQSRDIAMEQRMVRAEVVFLGGGEIQDEVEEAAHSHELAEGRLENTGRAEMLRAINAMSRAEALLNDGNVKQALVTEREALAHLERALDRRRYFLRTLPDRSRIDTTRRLIGERKDARSWNRDARESTPAAMLDASRQVMRELAVAATTPGSVDASLAARVAAINPASKELQGAAVAIAVASSDASRRAAVDAAMKAVTVHALSVFPSSTNVDLPSNTLSGALADELSRRPRR